MGPLAGPVVAAGAIFAPDSGIRGVYDSKQMPESRRLELEAEIQERALAWSVVTVSPEEIDRLNIYQAGLEAMRRVVAKLDPPPQFLLIDGRELPGVDLPQERVVKGDAKCHAIAAASILAKSERDRQMVALDARFPGYGFAEHKGYPTDAHRQAIRRLGPCAEHRRSFTLLPHPRLFE